ncbi:hypothetical protein KAU11_01820 [Candidatus Babeliales bacterium]|nr:hypothetical protein [Candidatus Babeliales bacterium]
MKIYRTLLWLIIISACQGTCICMSKKPELPIGKIFKYGKHMSSGKMPCIHELLQFDYNRPQFLASLCGAKRSLLKVPNDEKRKRCETFFRLEKIKYSNLIPRGWFTDLDLRKIGLCFEDFCRRSDMLYIRLLDSNSSVNDLKLIYKDYCFSRVMFFNAMQSLVASYDWVQKSVGILQLSPVWTIYQINGCISLYDIMKFLRCNNDMAQKVMNKICSKK